MFKIDWPCAVGGALLGYYTKGKVESTKAQFKGIYTGAIQNLKEAFSEESQGTGTGTQSTQQPQATQGNGKNG